MGIIHTLAYWQVIAAILIFLLTYILIITGLVHQTYAVLGGALLLVLFGILEADRVRQLMPWSTIGLLVGLMVMAGITNRSGVFSYFAIKAAQITKAKPLPLLVFLSMMSAIAGAWLDNLTAILLLVPITLSIAKLLKINAIPLVITIAISANLGGTATLIGSLPNVIIGTGVGLTFNDFVLNLTLPILVIYIVNVLLLSLFYFKSWDASKLQIAELMSIKPEIYIKDKGLVWKVMVVWAFVIAAFGLHPLLRYEMYFVALAGALLLSLLCVRKYGWRDVYRSVDWSTLLYVSGLFIVVGGLSAAGTVQLIVLKAMELTSGNLMYSSMLILWVTGIISATMDNKIFVTLMIPIIQDLGAQSQGALHPLWWSLALGAGLGGSGTLIGATGNLIAAGLAGRAGYTITFGKFLKVGVPLTLLSLLIASAYVMYNYYDWLK
jgi:Na+/H+ antiporter NhaD/arsenite permease-like protein